MRMVGGRAGAAASRRAQPPATAPFASARRIHTWGMPASSNGSEITVNPARR